MGFLEGTRADVSPERIVSPGFAGVSVGKAVGDDSANVPALVWRQVAISLSLGNLFMHGN